MLLPCRVVRRIEIAHFSDRHFWHGGYDKATTGWDAWDGLRRPTKAKASNLKDADFVTGMLRTSYVLS